MKAIQIDAFGSADVLQLRDLDIPQANAGEILIRVEASSVNYSDIARRSNAIYPFPTPLPFIPGGEVAGTIKALGADVEGFTVGMRVFGLVGTGSNGYAQYAVTPAPQVIPIPDGVSYEDAASLPIAGTTAMLLLREVGNLQADQIVLIHGAAGGVGSFAIQIARSLGAGTIIGTTSSEAKFEGILNHGADHAVNYTDDDWVKHVQDLTDGQGVDLVLEMSGDTIFAQSLQCLAPFGRIVVYGMASGEPLKFDDGSIVQFFYRPSLNQSIHVFNLGLWFGMRPQATGQALGDVIGLVASGQLDVSVNHILPLSEAAQAHRMIETRQTQGKVVLKPWDDASA
ncbi:MAG: quinone oxidoreductase [Chloroflexota bacterium]